MSLAVMLDKPTLPPTERDPGRFASRFIESRGTSAPRKAPKDLRVGALHLAGMRIPNETFRFFCKHTPEGTLTETLARLAP